MRTPAIFLLALLSLAPVRSHAQEPAAAASARPARRFCYTLNERTHDAVADYETFTQILIERQDNGAWAVIYNKNHTFLGCAKPGFSLTDLYGKSLSVPAAAVAKVFDAVGAIDFKNFKPRDERVPGPIENGVDIDADTSYLIPTDTARGKAVWAKLTPLMAAFMKDIARDIKIGETKHTLQGDFTKPRDVALAELLAHPDKYAGQRVRVTGWYHRYQFGGANALAVDKQAMDDKDMFIDGKATDLKAASSFSPPRTNWGEYNDCYITVEATFSGDTTMSGGLWLITKVTKK
ncbi:MAG TPA: hypothetical protein VG733_10400 [Chthoniobacteraceae bacterium]|nr:hypothetical protein [Chthoniobacteraceae bacterium]